MTRDHLIDRRTSGAHSALRRWLLFERLAVLAYGSLMRWSRSSRYTKLLARCRNSHQQRVELLAEEIRGLGGSPRESASWAVAVLAALPALVALWSERAALRVVHTCERRGRRAYARAVEAYPGGARVIARLRLLPEQRWTAASVAAVL